MRYIEAGALGKLQEIIIRDYPTFSGRALEEYFKCKFRESGEFTALGGYWNRKGEDEIDLIALDEIEKSSGCRNQTEQAEHQDGCFDAERDIRWNIGAWIWKICRQRFTLLIAEALCLRTLLQTYHFF